MGWTAYDYYTSQPIEFYAACEGYLEMQKESAMVTRFASFRIAEAFAGSKAIGNIDRFWPIGKKEAKVEPMSKERIEAIFKRHNIKRS